MPSNSDNETDRVVLNVNGSDVAVDADPDTPLLFVLRNDLGLTGAKLGCGLEQCGACAVLVDGEKVLSCNAPAGLFRDKCIVTPECGEHHGLSTVREAFVRAGAAQCGYCIPGMVVAATALLNTQSKPSDDQIRLALNQHLCRCGTHQRVLSAVRELARG